jgi:THO complex subunit 3
VAPPAGASSGGSSSEAKATPTTGFGGSAANASPLLKSFSLRPCYVDACIFSPSSHHLVAATSSDGYGELMAWNWEEEQEDDAKEEEKKQQQQQTIGGKRYVYPAHTGAIYACVFSPDGKHLATGGGDALVGLWDVDTMVCTSTITRCSTFIRSVSFSYDSQIVATSTEDDAVDLAMSDTGELVGKVSLSGGRSRAGGGPAGADEIAFHPKSYVLACARCDSVVHAPLTIVKLKVERQ